MRIPALSSVMPLARRVPEIRHDRSLRSSNRRSRDRWNHGAPESKPNPASQKSTTLLWNWSFSYQKVFLAHLHGFVVWSVHVSKSCHPRIDRTFVSTKNRLVVLPPRRVPEIWNRSPFIKSSIPGSSKSRCSRKKTNRPSLSTTLLWKWSLFNISYQNVFFQHTFVVSWLSWFCGLVCPSFKIWPSTYRSYVVRITVREHALWSCSSSKRFLHFLPLKIRAHNYTLKM